MSLIPGDTGTPSSFPDGFQVVGNGSPATPAFTFLSPSNNTGMYSPGDDQIAFSSNGVRSLLVGSSGSFTVGPESGSVQVSHTIYGYSNAFTWGNGTLNLSNRNGSNAVTIVMANNTTKFASWSSSNTFPWSVQDSSGNDLGYVSSSGAVTLGPTSSDALNHRVNGSIGLSSTLAMNSSSFRFVGSDNGGMMVGYSAFSTYLLAGGYYNGTSYIAKNANAALTGFRAAPITSDSDVAFEWYKNTDGDYTFSAGATLGTQTILSSMTAAGAWTLGNTAKIGSSDYAGQLLVGKTNGSAIPVGYVGQILESVYTSDTNFNSSGVWGNNASVTLTPGVWLLFGAFTAKLSTGGGMTAYHVDVSTTNGGSDGSPNNYAEALPPNAATNTQTTIAGVYANVTTNTTYYLNYRGVYSSGNPKHNGRLRAVRIA